MGCSTDGSTTICRPDPAHIGLLHTTPLIVHFGDGETYDTYVCPPIADSPRTQARCFKCGAKKWAKNLWVVRDAYRGPLVYCLDGCRAFKDRRNAAARRRYAQRRAEQGEGGDSPSAGDSNP